MFTAIDDHSLIAIRDNRSRESFDVIIRGYQTKPNVSLRLSVD